MIYDLDSCVLNERNGIYGGNAGNKEGVTINGEYWIIKYSKTTRGMRDELPSYTLSIRNSKLVVACKDFCKKEGFLRKIRTLKKIYIQQIISNARGKIFVNICLCRGFG